MTNYEEHAYSLTLGIKELSDVVPALLHTVLFHRSIGEVLLRQGCNGDDGCDAVLVGVDCLCSHPACSVAIQVRPLDYSCPYLDLTYVLCDCERLKTEVDQVTTSFKLSMADETQGRITLSFYEPSRGGLWGSAKNTWEQWNFDFKIDTVDIDGEEYRQRLATSTRETLSRISLDILRKDGHLPPNEKNSVEALPEKPFIHEITSKVGASATSTLGAMRAAILGLARG
eukprot:m.56273 g.56273  ORF g.56273 m.56273 type:complete len:228 (+) comp6992_c0_seq1:72-755(+)